MKGTFVLFIIAAYLVSSEALTCYQCVYPAVSSCGESFDATGTGVGNVTAKEKQSCAKIVFKRNDEVKVISRSYGDTVIPSTRADVEETVNIYYCTTDLCNGTTSITIAFSSIMIIAVLLAWKNC